MIAYASAPHPGVGTAEKPYSTDRNLLHVSYETGILEDPWRAPYEDMFRSRRRWRRRPTAAEDIEVDVEAARRSRERRALSPATLLAKLNTIAGRHGVGRVDIVENRYVGMKSRGVYETPGGTVLRAAINAVEQLTMDREVMHIRDGLVPRYAEMIYNGYWFAPEREMLQRRSTTRAVTGTARLRSLSRQRARDRPQGAEVALRPESRASKKPAATATRTRPASSA